VLLSASAVVLLWSSHLLPFYDYYQWLLQGHLVAGLLSGRSTDGQPLSTLYGLRPVPVPNLATPLGIGLLNLLIPIEKAGKLYLTLGVLGFVSSFGYLVRSVQQRPTAMEFTGFIWAFGFFLYKGYTSYLFALPIAFVIIALLHRSIVNSIAGPSRATLVGVTGLGAALYLSHLLAWTVAALATAVYALTLARRGQRNSATLLMSTLLPAVAMFGWYFLAVSGGSGISWYGSVRQKGVSLVEPLLAFLPVNPFPATFPLLVANLLVWLALAAVLAWNLNWSAFREKRFSRPVFWLGTVLAAAAVLIPISGLSDLIRPDERFTLPALLVILAALPFREFRFRRAIPMVCLVVVLLGAHAVEYRAVGKAMRNVDVAADTFLPARAPVLSVSLYVVDGGCSPSTTPLIDVASLKWFSTDFAMENGQPRVNFDATSFVYARFNPNSQPGLTMMAATVPEFIHQVLPSVASTYSYVQVLGCAPNVATVEAALAPQYHSVSRGEGFEIFRRADVKP